jgi:hypothetical protein
MAHTISATSLFAAARLFVTGRIFIEPKEKIVKREALWFDNEVKMIGYKVDLKKNKDIKSLKLLN